MARKKIDLDNVSMVQNTRRVLKKWTRKKRENNET